MQESGTKKPIVKVRRILRIKNTFYASIPREFIYLHGLKKGDPVPVFGKDWGSNLYRLTENTNFQKSGIMKSNS